MKKVTHKTGANQFTKKDGGRNDHQPNDKQPKVRAEVAKEHGINEGIVKTAVEVGRGIDKGEEVSIGRVAKTTTQQAVAQLKSSQKQLGRRNLTEKQKDYMIGKMYEARKNSVGAPKGNANAEKQNGQNVQIVSRREQQDGTAGQIGKEVGVDSRTVRRAGKFAQGVDALKAVSPEAAEGSAFPLYRFIYGPINKGIDAFALAFGVFLKAFFLLRFHSDFYTGNLFNVLLLRAFLRFGFLRNRNHLLVH